MSKKVLSPERQQEIRQLALQLQNVKIEQRYKTLRWLLFLAAGFFALSYIYYEYANKRINSSRENIVAQLNHHIGLAAGGDSKIEERITGELPLLQQYVQVQLEKDRASRIPPPSVETDADKFRPVAAFVRVNNRTLSVGKILSAEDIVTIDDGAGSGHNWYTVTLKEGLPVWVSSSYVERSMQSLLEGTTITRVRIRRTPNLRQDSIVGVVDKGVVLSLIEQEGDWLKIRTPKDFQFIVRKREYERLKMKDSL